MDIIVITDRYDDDKFGMMLEPSLKQLNVKCVNVHNTPNADDPSKKISNKYNVGIITAIQNNLIFEDTIVILCKSNVSIADPMTTEKLKHIFTTQPNVGMVGVKGVKTLNPVVDMYHTDNTPLNGLVYNVKDANTGEYLGTDKKGYFIDVISVDDSIMCIRGSILKKHNKLFDIDLDRGFGIEATVKILKAGYHVAVIDMFVISNEYTDVDGEMIYHICDKLNLTFPVTVESLML